MKSTVRSARLLVGVTALATLVPADPVRGLGHIWSNDPANYPRINIAQTADRQITYKVDFSGFLFSPNQTFTRDEVSLMEEGVHRAFAVWNDVLAPLGLQFVRKEVYQSAELSVFAFDYEPLLPDQYFGDSVAGANTLPTPNQVTLLPIVFDNTEPFAALDLLPSILERPLQQPYIRYVRSDRIDVFTVALHEIGHELGLAHPNESFLNGGNFNFLALPSVLVEPTCLTPSDYVGGENIRLRRPMLLTEIDSVVTPIRQGGVFMEIPPEDMAFVAFNLRYLNPEGADAILARAKARFEQTCPLRFANVKTELEAREDGPKNNDVPNQAMLIQPPIILIGSVGVTRQNAAKQDQDYFRFEVLPDQVGRTWYVDVDAGGGLEGVEWVDSMLEILDADGNIIVQADDSIELDPGSISTVDPLLQWVPDSPGTYYVTIRSELSLGENGGTGDYVLKIGIDEIPEPAGRAALPVDPSIENCQKTGQLPEAKTTACGALGSLFFPMTILPLGIVAARRRIVRRHP